ncbi:MAG TPA: hypothetical protein VKH35_10915 [Thermoanaerobaculia bacterium]|nr:hypothetical protein [Thermoanaerobaculia bacterium]
MKLDLHDYLIRGLFLFAGAIAAVLLVLKGFGPVLPALAIGGMAGAFAVSRFGPSEE